MNLAMNQVTLESTSGECAEHSIGNTCAKVRKYAGVSIDVSDHAKDG